MYSVKSVQGGGMESAKNMYMEYFLPFLYRFGKILSTLVKIQAIFIYGGTYFISFLYRAGRFSKKMYMGVEKRQGLN